MVITNRRVNMKREKRIIIKSFLERYKNSCQSMGIRPSPSIVDTSLELNTLEVNADMLTFSDWRPLLQSLARDNSLTSVNFMSGHPLTIFTESVTTEDGARKSKLPPTCTYYIMSCIMDSFGKCFRVTESLITVKLSHLWLKGKDLLGYFSTGLRQNCSIQEISFEHCAITDAGFQIFCSAIEGRTNIKILKFINCNVTAGNIVHLAQMIKMQNWKKKKNISQYGLEILNISENPNCGDQGLFILADVLERNLYLKVVRAQHCGLSNASVEMVLNLIGKSKTLEEFDLVRNPDISPKMIQIINNLFEAKALKIAQAKEKQLDPGFELGITLNYEKNKNFDVKLKGKNTSTVDSGFSLQSKRYESGDGLNPFAKINETNLKEHINKVKFSCGKEGLHTDKSAFQNILDGTVQELFEAMEPGLKSKAVLMTPLGKGTEVKVKQFIEQIIPKSERRKLLNTSDIIFGLHEKTNLLVKKTTPKRIKSFKNDKNVFHGTIEGMATNLSTVNEVMLSALKKKSMKSTVKHKYKDWDQRPFGEECADAIYDSSDDTEMRTLLLEEGLGNFEETYSNGNASKENLDCKTVKEEERVSSELEESLERILLKVEESLEAELLKVEESLEDLSLENITKEKAESFEDPSLNLIEKPLKNGLCVPNRKTCMKKKKEAGISSKEETFLAPKEEIFDIEMGLKAAKKNNLGLASPNSKNSLDKTQDLTFEGCWNQSVSKEVNQTIDEKLHLVRKTFGLIENPSQFSGEAHSNSLPYTRKVLLASAAIKNEDSFNEREKKKSIYMIEKNWKTSPTSKTGNIIFIPIDNSFGV